MRTYIWYCLIPVEVPCALRFYNFCDTSHFVCCKYLENWVKFPSQFEES